MSDKFKCWQCIDGMNILIFTHITNEWRAVCIHRIREAVLEKLAVIVATKIITVVSLDSGLFFCDLILGRIYEMIWGRIYEMIFNNVCLRDE
jgi:hypothetical protein